MIFLSIFAVLIIIVVCFIILDAFHPAFASNRTESNGPKIINATANSQSITSFKQGPPAPPEPQSITSFKQGPPAPPEPQSSSISAGEKPVGLREEPNQDLKLALPSSSSIFLHELPFSHPHDRPSVDHVSSMINAPPDETPIYSEGGQR